MKFSIDTFFREISFLCYSSKRSQENWNFVQVGIKRKLQTFIIEDYFKIQTYAQKFDIKLYILTP